MPQNGPTLLVDGGKLREARRARGFAQLDLAIVCGVTQSAVSRWERPGVSRLDVSLVELIAHALHVRRRMLVTSARCSWCDQTAQPGDRLVMVGTYGLAHEIECAAALDDALGSQPLVS